MSLESEQPLNEIEIASFDRRALIIPIAAVIITAMCIWRVMTPREKMPPGAVPDLKQAAPAFQLYDQTSSLVKLEAYLNRHQMVVVFYDGQAGPEANATLRQLRDVYPALKRESIMVFGVSTALPQENRNNSSQPFPFALLTDADAISERSAHRVWGRFVKPTSLDKPPGTKPGAFLIDRSGLVRWDINNNCPRPEEDVTNLVSQLLGA